MKSLRTGVILSHIDFSENYRFESYNEIQAEYYDSVNVTILVHITLRVVVCLLTNNETIVKESHFYISDDYSHDTLFVQYYLIQHWKWLDAQEINPSEHIVFFDGAASQFKNRQALYYVAMYLGIAKGCRMQWQYFGSAHRKGKSILHLSNCCTRGIC
jgi:hypothetical protein